MKLGVLGGTFDPIHNGHIAAAAAVEQALGLDAIILIPSRIPPHRHDPVPADTGVAEEGRVPGAIDNPAAANQKVEILWRRKRRQQQERQNLESTHG
jgi:cytidyltransferase-like protein